jgi:hypothetical protein
MHSHTFCPPVRKIVGKSVGSLLSLFDIQWTTFQENYRLLLWLMLQMEP